MTGRRRWTLRAAAAAAGAALGGTAFTGGALLLYSAEGFLTSAGLLLAAVLVGLAAGVWVGTPDAGAGRPRMTGRWMLAILALAVASFAATAWLRVPALQTFALAGPLGMVLFLAEPAYAIGAVLAGLAAWGRTGGPTAGGTAGAVAVAALLGAGLGAILAGAWLIPALPPGPIFFGAALLLSATGTMEMAMRDEGTEDAMEEAVVLVTGAGKAGHVGYALARAFLERGARVVLCDRAPDVSDLAATLGANAAGVSADLSTEEGAAAAVGAAIERWGRLDVVVNAVGGLRVMKPLAETSPEEWAGEFDRNVRTAFLVSRAAVPHLRASRGAIINFASPAAERPVKRLGAYSAAKAGVAALTKAMAAEEKEAGVRVNAVAPGLVDTASNRAEAKEGTRFVSREAIAEAVLFLATARGVTGEVVGVTRGDVGEDTP